MRPKRRIRPELRKRRGSVLLLVLFVCLAIALATQTLVAVALSNERAVAAERAGRDLQAGRDESLATLREWATDDWEEHPWTAIEGMEAGTEGRLRGPGSDPWVMEADVRQNNGEWGIGASAWVERGRDGVDLPLAALVAQSILAAPVRENAVVDSEGPADGVAPVFLGAGGDVPAMGAGCVLRTLAQAWRLDQGWVALTEPGPGLSLGPGVLVLQGSRGETVLLTRELEKLGMGQDGEPTIASGGPALSLGRGGGSPLLVVLTGGADLDGKDLGDLYGVLVVDGGSVQLEGTTVHGAVFVTKIVDLGTEGRLLFSLSILRWAADRSLVRTRLAPGSRAEGTGEGTD